MSISAYIYDWLKNIVVILILVSILNILMPKGNMKKYMEHITGLLLIYVIIFPILNLFNINFNLEKEIFKNIYNINNSLNKDEILNSYNEEIEELYVKKIENKIKEIVEENNNYKLLDIEINIDTREVTYGQIKEVKLLLDNKAKENQNNKKVRIEKINSKFPKNNEEIRKTVLSNLEERLYAELGINRDSLYIYIKN